MKSSSLFLSLPVLLFIGACGVSEEKLPVLQDPKILVTEKSSHRISHFSFTDQDGKEVTNATFQDKIYVADFIFLSCTTICPLMNTELQKAYEAFKDDDRVLFLSHTIDPANDSIQALKHYADNLGVATNKWHFVTGNKDSIYTVAERDYFISAASDSTNTDGLVHAGGLILVDKNRNIRGVYDGTESTETERLIHDIRQLLKEQF